MIGARHLKFFTKVAAAALALGALAMGGNAQNAYEGKFTLPVETHWGTATLPAGDYTFAMQSGGRPYRFFVRGEKVSVIILATSIDYEHASGHAQLNLVNVADVHTVETFDAPELGLTFFYATPAQKHDGQKDAHQKLASQPAPASTVSENRSSIAVHAAGR